MQVTKLWKEDAEMLKGIDIYNHTRVSGLDLVRAKAGGIQYVIVKATEGVDYTDPSFVANMSDAHKVGLPVGAYHLMRATPIDQQAHDFLAAIDGRGPYCCLAIDVEDVGGPELSGLGEAAITSRIMTLYKAIRAAGYICPVYVYASAAWLHSLINVTACRKAGLLIWMAAYSDDTPDSTDRSADCDMWQWCSDGKVPGVTGDTDCNTCYRGIGASAPAKPVSAPIDTAVHAYYRVRVGGVWLPEVQDLTDFAGIAGRPITDVVMRVSAGTIKYRVHVLNGKWLPYVTGCDINNPNGYAGDGREIDAVQAIYYTPEALKPSKCAKYRVAPVGGNYYPWQIDNQTTGGQDGYAGTFGQTMDRLQFCIE